jgi:hypothetical protein
MGLSCLACRRVAPWLTILLCISVSRQGARLLGSRRQGALADAEGGQGREEEGAEGPRLPEAEVQPAVRQCW